MQKKKIKEILVGSNNKGKIKEIKDLLPKNCKVLNSNYFKLKSPKETGKTFIENSLIKAKYFFNKTKKVCLADDSGLEIDLLNNSPGIFSARWGGKNNNFKTAINKVYKELNRKDKNWKKKIITAKFVCALTIFGFKNKPIHSIGIVKGKISKKKKGKNGFGYDPIFIPRGSSLTFAQMKYSEKNRIDHRYLAFKKIKKFF